MKFDDYVKPYLENMREPDLDATIQFADTATQAMFASIWGDWIEENSRHSVKYRGIISGKDLLEIAPHYSEFMKPREKRQLEDKIYGFIARFEEANGNNDILDLYNKALQIDGQYTQEEPDSNSTPEMFGYNVIMKMLGAGISWEDDHKDAGFNYPHVELSYLEFPESFHEIEPDEEEEDFDDEIEDDDWKREGEDWKGDDFRKDSGDDWKK